MEYDLKNYTLFFDIENFLTASCATNLLITSVFRGHGSTLYEEATWHGPGMDFASRASTGDTLADNRDDVLGLYKHTLSPICTKPSEKLDSST